MSGVIEGKLSRREISERQGSVVAAIKLLKIHLKKTQAVDADRLNVLQGAKLYIKYKTFVQMTRVYLLNLLDQNKSFPCRFCFQTIFWKCAT